MFWYGTFFFFFTSEEAGLNDFQGVTWEWRLFLIQVTRCFKTLISGFHTSSVDLNICVRKGSGREESEKKELSAHTEEDWADLLAWEVLFIPFPFFPKQLSACLPACCQCSVIPLVHKHLLAVMEGELMFVKSLQIFSSRSLKSTVVFCVSCFCCLFFFGFLEDLENPEQIH